LTELTRFVEIYEIIGIIDVIELNAFSL